ncbi:MAG: TlpA family protein disulfide reductase [Planctomycetes bacterium]|nr:TlpA family protein disulfide reductase [Planctomycetota bacterium]
MKRLLLLSPVILVLASCATQQARLTIGDPAPALAVSDWVKGAPVEVKLAGDVQQSDRDVVVLEFWATWCGPCVAAIPHVTEMQQTYKDKGVRIVGVTAHDDNNTLEMVEEFVKEQGDAMGYGVAFDKDGATYKAYMKAAGQNGIPTTFILDRSGRVAWIGHPMNMDEPLERIVSGKFDIEVAKQTYTIRQDLNKAYQDAQRHKFAAEDAAAEQDWKKVIRLADSLIALEPENSSPWMTKFRVYDGQLDQPSNALAAANKAVALLQDKPEGLSRIARQLVRAEDASGFNPLANQAIERAVAMEPDSADVRLAQYHVLATQEKDEQAWTAAKKAIELAKDDPTMLSRAARMLGNPDAPTGCHDLALEAVELAIAAEPEAYGHLRVKFDILVKCRKDIKGASAIGRYMVEQASEEAGFLNNFSWSLLTDEPLKGQFNELALVAAEKCHHASGGENYMYLDTFALAQFENGAVAEAVELQKQAVELCPKDSSLMAELKERLEQFKKDAK